MLQSSCKLQCSTLLEPNSQARHLKRHCAVAAPFMAAYRDEQLPEELRTDFEKATDVDQMVKLIEEFNKDLLKCQGP